MSDNTPRRNFYGLLREDGLFWNPERFKWTDKLDADCLYNEWFDAAEMGDFDAREYAEDQEIEIITVAVPLIQHEIIKREVLPKPEDQ